MRDLLISEFAETWAWGLWIPPEEGDRTPVTPNAKALGAGLAFRSLADTVTDTLRFHRSRGEKHVLRAGLKRDREKEILAAWHAVKK